MNDINGNPIRFLAQTRKYNCGQTAVSMITGLDLHTVMKAFGTKSSTYMHQTVTVIRKLGVECKEYEAFKGALPAMALVRIAPYKCSGGRRSMNKFKNFGHLVVVVNGTVFDPNGSTYPVSILGPGQRCGITHVIEVAPKHKPAIQMISEDSWVW
jgi:hypothetical protein